MGELCNCNLFGKTWDRYLVSINEWSPVPSFRQGWRSPTPSSQSPNHQSARWWSCWPFIFVIYQMVPWKPFSTSIVQWWSHSCSKVRIMLLLFSTLVTRWLFLRFGAKRSFSIRRSSAVKGEMAPPISKTPLNMLEVNKDISTRKQKWPPRYCRGMEVSGMGQLRSWLPSGTCQLTSNIPLTS